MTIIIDGNFLSVFFNLYKETDENRKKELTEKIKNEVFPNMVATLEKFLVQNGGEFLVGDAVKAVKL